MIISKEYERMRYDWKALHVVYPVIPNQDMAQFM